MANLFHLQRQGSDIASATSITVGDDGDRFDITGTTTITTITASNRAAGARVYLQFDGACTVQHGTILLKNDTDFTSAAGDFLGLEYNGSAWTEFYRWRDNSETFLGTIINLGASTELTIATGAITVTQSHHTVDTESDAATDDLDTISGGTSGDVIFLRSENSGRAVTLKHGTGNIQVSTGADHVMTAKGPCILVYDGTDWQFRA